MRRRILLAILGVTAGSILLFSLPLALVAQRLYREQEVLSLERDAIAASRTFDSRAQPGDPVELPASDDLQTAYDRRGRLLGGTGPRAPGPIVTQALASGRITDGESDGRLVVAAPILASERVVGVIRISRSTEGLSRRVLHARLGLGAAVLVIIAIAAAAALRLSRRLTKPLEGLAGAAKRVGRGDMSARAQQSGIEELDVVASALDATSSRIGELLARERASSANASHQLRTPLAALRLELETRQLAGEDVVRPLEQVERLEGTIATLLSSTREETHNQEPFAVGPLLEELRQDWIGPFALRGRVIEVGSIVDSPSADVPRAPVREILEVLVDNALRHGGGTAYVTARTIRGHLAIDVADEGPGVQEAEGIFDRRSGAGHGIGLALARTLAADSGGRLELSDSKKGRTRFTLLVPTVTALSRESPFRKDESSARE